VKPREKPRKTLIQILVAPTGYDTFDPGILRGYTGRRLAPIGVSDPLSPRYEDWSSVQSGLRWPLTHGGSMA